MEIIINGKAYNEARLYSMKKYSEKSNIPLSTINYRMMTGKLEVLEIAGVKFVVEKDDK